ncbi:hypothetical protein ACI7RC_16980 [Brevibacillus sp. B_LB10_24]|uniref:hypothetical protein n=1 Tax=Brevibacillus sp. B_LB10_24 TaxID=3380645 RepID=UPI0038BE114C
MLIDQKTDTIDMAKNILKEIDHSTLTKINRALEGVHCKLALADINEIRVAKCEFVKKGVLLLERTTCFRIETYAVHVNNARMTNPYFHQLQRLA